MFFFSRRSVLGLLPRNPKHIPVVVLERTVGFSPLPFGWVGVFPGGFPGGFCRNQMLLPFKVLSRFSLF